MGYDRQNAYAYDPNGRLAPKGSGTTGTVTPYNNLLFRRGNSLSHELSFEARMNTYEGAEIGWRVEGAQQEEALTLQQNRNRRQQFMTSFRYIRKYWTLGGDFQYTATSFSNPNRNGFLQYVYRQSLLAPATFDLRYNEDKGAFGDGMDNPLFLLNGNGQYARTFGRQVKMNARYEKGDFTVSVEPSLRWSEDNIMMHYKAGSAMYPQGNSLLRMQRDRFSQLRTSLGYDVDMRSNMLNNLTFQIGYVLNDDKTHIGLQGTDPRAPYNYQRSSHRLTASGSMDMEINYDLDVDVEGGVAMYRSNTLPGSVPLLPWFGVRAIWEPLGVSFGAALNYRKEVIELRQEESSPRRACWNPKAITPAASCLYVRCAHSMGFPLYGNRNGIAG